MIARFDQSPFTGPPQYSSSRCTLLFVLRVYACDCLFVCMYVLREVQYSLASPPANEAATRIGCQTHLLPLDECRFLCGLHMRNRQQHTPRCTSSKNKETGSHPAKRQYIPTWAVERCAPTWNLQGWLDLLVANATSSSEYQMLLFSRVSVVLV
jgi:hypothetical protein